MQANQRPIILWFLSGCLLIMTMVVVGGITRLTGSGLSITEWNVIMGAVPPLNQTDWQIAFEKYQQSPQFKQVNANMDLASFKFIFFWEFIHRFIGRLIGIVFIVPFIVFYFQKKLDATLIRKSLFLFALGGLQGFIGWYMVKSGLVNMPAVSHYRLAVHLITAFITFGCTFWFALDLMYPLKRTTALKTNGMKVLTRILGVLVVLQILYGAFVAGLHAGKIYTTFPKMGDSWMPDPVWSYPSFIQNITENPSGVQFIHRCLAGIVSTLIFIVYFKYRHLHSVPGLKQGLLVMMGMLCLQVVLGIFTLLYAVPISLGVLHQLGAFFLFSAVVFVNHRTHSI